MDNAFSVKNTNIKIILHLLALMYMAYFYFCTSSQEVKHFKFRKHFV